MQNKKNPHSFHVPVMGLAFTIDSPIKIAKYGISSVISIVDDILIEKMNEYYSKKFELPFKAISTKVEDYRAKRITSYLNLISDLAEKKFDDLKNIRDRLKPLQDVGLGYVKLGQGSNTLSGGEAQRVKLAFFLSKVSPNKEGGTLFIFDEPTTGLHFHDIKKLMASFQALIAQGNTVICIEHNLDVIKCADWIIDLGPEAGNAGGNLVFQGLPEDIHLAADSITGPYLMEKLK